MEPKARQWFNAQYTDDAYLRFLEGLNAGLPKPVQFRVAETPIFVPDDFRDQLLAACEDMVNTILRPDFKQLTERAIPEKWRMATPENNHPHFLAFDFGVCSDTEGRLVPRLIELQGFPSLYGFQLYLDQQYHQAFHIPNHWTSLLGNLSKETYIELLRRTIVGPYQQEEVVLMDVNAPEQKTAVDFYSTQQYLGIPVMSLSDLIRHDNQLYYHTEDGRLQRIRRIYNRLIFDEIDGDPEIFDKVVDVRQPLDVEWVTHPHWFYRVSKFTMPFLEGDYVPQTQFLHEVPTIPTDLQNYVLKPLFSFAGQGVIIDVRPEDIAAIPDPENWILQQKVTYQPAVQSPEGGVKAEIRMLYLWPDGDVRPTPAITLSRLSRGKMIGVRYNKDYDWVGGNIAFVNRPVDS